MSASVTPCPPETARVHPENPEREMPMTSKTKTQSEPLPAYDPALRKTLAHVLAAVDRSTALSPTRLRDLRSAVMRVAHLLGNVPSRIALDLPAIATSLAAVSQGPLGASLAPALCAPLTSTGAPWPLALRALCERPRNRPGGGQRCDGRGFHHRRS